MADKGIIFSAPMVRALLDGRKSQTRRLIQPTTKPMGPGMILRAAGKRFGGTGYLFDPPYRRGDRLYVREAHRLTDCTCTEACRLPGNVYYEAGDNDERGRCYMLNRLRPSIHMPRWASRLTLIVTDVRVQRLQECSEADAIAEGIERIDDPRGTAWKSYETCADGTPHPHASVPNRSPLRSYEELWNSLHTAEGQRWQDNPWIYALTFEVQRGNIDQLEKANG